MADFRIRIEMVEGDPIADTMDSFLEANADGLDETEIAELQALEPGQVWHGGGGAAPMYRVIRLSESAQASSEPGLSQSAQLYITRRDGILRQMESIRNTLLKHNSAEATWGEAADLGLILELVSRAKDQLGGTN